MGVWGSLCVSLCVPASEIELYKAGTLAIISSSRVWFGTPSEKLVLMLFLILYKPVAAVAAQAEL